MHNCEIKIPEMKGKRIDEVKNFFKRENLNYQVVDSFFIPGIVVGGIIKTYPSAGEKVKPGKTIYITCNMYNSSLLTVPEVVALSRKEAQSLLEMNGFRSVTVKTIRGIYKDLVLRLETGKGYKLKEGGNVC